MSEVSVILPTYNGERFIKESIESVLNQTYTDFELIIIDDGSTSSSESIINSLSDKRIKFIRNKTNMGLQKTLNKAIRAAQGKYIARIDDDDFWNDKNKLQKQVEQLEENKKLVLIGTGMHAADEFGNKKFDLILPETDEKIRNQILSQTSFVHPSVCFRKETFISCGGYDESKRTEHVEDHDLWLKFGLIGEFYNIPYPSVTVRFHSKSVIGKNFMRQQYREMLLIFKYRKYYPNFYKSVIVSVLRIAYRTFLKPR